MEGNEKKKIRVLEVVSGLSTEGIGTLLLNVYENNNKDEMDISFALATKFEQTYEKRLIEQGANIYRTAEIGDGLKGKINHFIELIAIIKKEGPFDAVHTHMDFFNGINLIAAYIAGVKVRVSHAHLAVGKESLSLPKRIYNTCMKTLIRIFANERVGCSNNANIYMNSKKDGIVINNGVNLERFRTSQKAENLVVSDENINFVTIGRIEEQKNPVFIVEVMKELSKLNNKVKLYWVGFGTMEHQIKELIAKYKLEDTIIMLGKREDVPNILTSMDYMLFPSKWEGLPVTLVEVQVARIPCFIADTITKEVDLGLCNYLKLDKHEGEWAKDINDSINNKTYKNKIDEMKVEKFDIKYTIKQLKAVYTA